MRVPVLVITIAAILLAAPHVNAASNWTATGNFVAGAPSQSGDNACLDRAQGDANPTPFRFSSCVDLPPITAGKAYRLIAQGTGGIVSGLNACFYAAQELGGATPQKIRCDGLYDADSLAAGQPPASNGYLLGGIPTTAVMVSISADVGAQVSWHLTVFLTQ